MLGYLTHIDTFAGGFNNFSVKIVEVFELLLNSAFNYAEDSIMSIETAQQTIGGNLGEWPLDQIIDSLSSTSKTGLIQIGSSEIWFESGSIYLVRTESSPNLSKTLYNAEVATLTEIDDRFYSEDERSVIDQLIEEYPISQDRLRLVMDEYNLAGLLELLVPSDVDFEIHPEQVHRLGSSLAADANAFVGKAKYRLQIWKKIASAISGVDAVFAVNGALPESQPSRNISADEWKYLSRVNGHNTVEQIVYETQEPAFRVCTSLYRLQLEGLITEKAE